MTTSPAKITARQFAALSRPEQLALLRRGTARQQARLLLDARDGAELLACLPPQDLYLLARELGPDQIADLLSMAAPGQWTAFLDFDCWDGDRFDAAAARAWLAVLLEGEAEQVAATLQEIDFELLVLLLQHEVEVRSGPEDLLDDDRADGLPRLGGYLLAYRGEEGAKLYGGLLAVLMEQAPEFARYLLEAIRAEGESLLEESVYRQRAGRLLDQGLPEPHEARRVYAWLDPERFTSGGAPKIPLGGSSGGVAPSGALQLASPEGLLARVLAAGYGDETAWELACLLNKVLMAEEVDLGDLGSVRTLAGRCYATLNLGLEFLAGADDASAARVVANNYLEELFRLGYSLTMRLQRRARAVRESAAGPYLDGADRRLAAALLHTPPLYAEALDNLHSAGQRLFSTVAELRQAEAALANLEIRQRLFTEHFPFELPPPQGWELTGCQPAQGSELTLQVIFLTALANRLLGRPFAPQPLAAVDLAPLHRLVCRDAAVDRPLREQTRAWLEALEAGAGAFGDAALQLWADEFCSVAADALDPRFVGGLILRLP